MFDRGEAYEKILIADLQRVIDFLKFAETKNAALLALSSAWTLATIGLECAGHELPYALVYTIPVTLVLVLIAALLAAVSFFPKNSLPPFLGGKKAGPHAPNLLFFGDIARLTAKEFEAGVHARYYPDEDKQRDEYLHDLTVQINANSAITLRKMTLFKWAVGFAIAAGCVLLISSLMLAYTSLKGVA